MKIIGGQWRGRLLAAPTGEETRPTGARAREALFSMLGSEIGSFEDLRIADLFAGTGALGLEALSRGAQHCTFIERGRPALSALHANIHALGCGEQCTVIPRAAPEIGKVAAPVHIAFLDAPYGRELTAPTLAALLEKEWLASGAFVAAELGPEETDRFPGYETLKSRRYGKAVIAVLQPQG